MKTHSAVSHNSRPPDGSILSSVLLCILLIAALGFGVWAFIGRQDYKTNSDQKAAAAVTSSKKQQAAELQAQFAEQSKSPNKSFQGSATYGSVSFSYPKTWSAYVDTSNSSEPINAYFHPNQVPGINSNTAYALRVELVASDYAQIIQQFSNTVSQGTLSAKAYLPSRMSGVANVQPGTLFIGQINPNDTTQQGKLLVIRVRDKTLQISTQSNDYSSDFNNIILTSLTFAP